MEDKRSAEIQQVFSAIERLTKAMETIQLALPAPEHRAGKQPLFTNSTPPLLDTTDGSPAVAFNGSAVTQDPSDNPQPSNYNDQTQRPLRTPRIEVPIFSGDNAGGWLFQLNRYFTINHTPPDEMLEAAPLFMARDALCWYQWKYDTGQISTWTKLALDIKRRFGPSEYYDAEVAINQLVQITSVQAYTSDFEKLSAGAPRLVGPNLLSRFIAGLKEDIRHELVLFKPPDLDKAMGLARVIEDKLLSQRRFTPRLPSSRPPYRPYQESPRPNPNPLPITLDTN
ncbi:unnamed protein product [Rhodiola kirilowii]